MEKRTNRWLTILCIVMLFTIVLQGAEKPLTVAESSDYTKTSRYQDVMQFIRTLQQSSPLLRVETLGRSTEGRDIPLMVLGNPVPQAPGDLQYDDRMVVYIQANIHAGEVEGKEASLMLARDILLNTDLPFLDDLVILIAPIFNADGNEKISKENRRRQAGPEGGVGVRYNGQKLDLNRDGVKLESPEIRGMVRQVLNRWDPVLLVDCHTTNGSYHEEPVTYTWSLNPNGDQRLVDHMRTEFMPFVQKRMEDEFGVLSIVYGNFLDQREPEKGWVTAGPQCRYITNYIGLRNRLSILNENYAYADYRMRVLGCYAFLHSVLEHCERSKETIVDLIRRADRETIRKGHQPEADDLFHIAYDREAYDEIVTIRGWEMEVVPREGSWPLVKKTDQKRTYRAPYFSKYVPNRSIAYPAGYFIDVKDPEVIGNLLDHGITVHLLSESVTVSVESFRPSEVKRADRLYQGHYNQTLKGEYISQEKTFPAGTVYVPTAQRLGILAAYLLEPESDDGLFVWNFFDRYLVAQWGSGLQMAPVHRLLKPKAFATETLTE